MTRSSTSELFTPYKEPEQEFRSSRRHFKTLSLDELRSPDFKSFSDQEYSEKEVAEKMAETMEQYMSKTRDDYGSGVARPKIEDNDNFELKGQFLKEPISQELRASIKTLGIKIGQEAISKVLLERGGFVKSALLYVKCKPEIIKYPLDRNRTMMYEDMTNVRFCFHIRLKYGYYCEGKRGIIWDHILRMLLEASPYQ
ncbi:hypothetical protein Tco_0764786 [Tanacetum coccineum]